MIVPNAVTIKAMEDARSGNMKDFSLEDFRNGLHITLSPEDYDLVVDLIENGMSEDSKNAVEALINKPSPWELNL